MRDTHAQNQSIGDYYAYCKELINGDSVYDFDVTKLSIFTLDIGLAGIEVYDLLRDEYGIQIEFGDIGNILAYISVGDSEANIERLIGALLEIRRRFKKDRTGMFDHEYINPEVVISPQAAFYGEKNRCRFIKVLIESAVNLLCVILREFQF